MQEFGTGGEGATARVVVQAPDGQTLTTPENAAALGELVGVLSELPGVASATNPLDPAAPSVNADQDTAYSTVTYTSAPGEVTPAEQEALLDAVDEARSGGFTVEAAGEATQEAAARRRPRRGRSVSSSPWWSSPSPTARWPWPA